MYLKFDEYNRYKEHLASVAALKESTDAKVDLDKLQKQVESDIERCYAIIIGRYKFFAEFIYNLRVLYTYRVDTMATDGKNIFINPKFANSLTDKQCVFVLCHEILHCLLVHFTRAKAHSVNLGNEAEREKWNYAADYELNPMLVEEGLLTKEEVKKMGALYDEKYIDKTAEWIYDNLGDIDPPDPVGADKDFPAEVGSYVKMQDGKYGKITGITAAGEYEIEEITKAELDKAFGVV